MAFTTIDDPSAYFKVQLYVGNATTGKTVVFDDTDTNMSPDFIWIKNRDGADPHHVFDNVRTVGQRLRTNQTDGASFVDASDDLQQVRSHDSDGFTLGNNTDVNGNTENFVAWCWKESATAGFDIISYTGNATNRTVSHSLSAVPHMMVVKNTVDPEHWRCYHHKIASDPETDYINFSLNEAVEDNNLLWNDTAPTSSVFSVGTDSGVNGNTDAMIAYLWTSIQGFSKFGSYRGNDGNDGAFVYTGFKPAYVMTKKYSATGASWQICDNKRPGFNVINDSLSADDSVVEATHVAMDFCANGFKCRNSNRDSNHNALYIFMAFAEQPFVNSEGVPNNAE